MANVVQRAWDHQNAEPYDGVAKQKAP
jgi:hypothetical protein